MLNKKSTFLIVTSIILSLVSVFVLEYGTSSASQLTSVTFVPQVTNLPCTPGLIFYSSSTNQFMGCSNTSTPVAFGAGSQVNAAYVTQGTFGSGASGSNSQYIFKPTTDTTGMLQIQSSGGTVVFNVDTANKRVGIGTAAPSSALAVNGTITVVSGTVTGLANPVQSTDAATKAYVDMQGCHQQTYATSGAYTFVKPSNVSLVSVTLAGGGGGGGGGSWQSGGGGGGGGAVVAGYYYAISGNVSVVVGGAGGGGTGGDVNSNGYSGGSGGTSSFGTLTVSGGVGGGGGSTGGVNGGGGSGATSAAGYAGGNGGSNGSGGSNAGAYYGGDGSGFGAGGGASALGNGGAGSSNAANGAAGTNFGAGGGGGGNETGGQGGNGGAGGSGVVIVTWCGS